MAKQALRRPCEARDEPSIRALTIDADMHHHLLAVLINAVDRLPGGARAIKGAIDSMAERDALPTAITGSPDLSSLMARQFVAVHVAEPFDRTTRASPEPILFTSRQDARHVE